MPSSVPLINAIAQNTVDFNNQTPTNASGLFRYKINNYSAPRIFTDTDLNSVCIFNDVGTIVDVYLNSNYFSTTPPVGAEIIFYSTTGNIRINTSGVGYLASSFGPFTTGANSAGKIIHRGGNVWYFASANATPQQYSWTNCCGNGGELYQITNTPGFNYSLRSYFDLGIERPYNGTVFDYDTQLYYRIVNGVYAANYVECAPTSFGTGYNFYDAPDPIYGQTVTLYAVTGLNSADPISLLGNKFFVDQVGQQYDCYAASLVPDGATYYTSTTSPYYALTFYGSYVSSYTYQP